MPASEEMQCKECLTWTHEDGWVEAETFCEDCGSHMAHKCPKCGEVYDDVYRWGDLPTRPAPVESPCLQT